MYNPSTLRTGLLALAGALLAMAPPAAGQDPAFTALASVVGDPIAYRVDLPQGLELHRKGRGSLISFQRSALTVIVSAWKVAELTDLRVLQPAGSPAEVEARLLASDSLMVALWENTRCPYGGPGVTVRERRSLGGEPAVYLRGRYAEDIYAGWYEGYVALRDGVVYTLTFQVEGDDYAAYEPLLARIRDSFRFPPPKERGNVPRENGVQTRSSRGLASPAALLSFD